VTDVFFGFVWTLQSAFSGTGGVLVLVGGGVGAAVTGATVAGGGGVVRGGRGVATRAGRANRAPAMRLGGPLVDVAGVGGGVVVTVGTTTGAGTVENVYTTGGAVSLAMLTGTGVGGGLLSVTLAASLAMCRPRPITPAPNSAPAVHDPTIVPRRRRRSGFASRTAAPTILPSHPQRPRRADHSRPGTSRLRSRFPKPQLPASEPVGSCHPRSLGDRRVGGGQGGATYPP
jgi:hypothetical protein